MRYIVQIFFLFLIFNKAVFAQKPNSICVLTGVVKNRASDTLYIRKSTQDLRAFLENPIKIPIQKGMFYYKLSFSETEAFELIFQDEIENGSWSPILFFPFQGSVQTTLLLHDPGRF